MASTCIILFLFLTVAFVCGSSIFYHVPFSEGSHYFVFKRISKELINRGHNVTLLVDNRFEETAKSDGNMEGFNVEVFQTPITLYQYKQMRENMTKAGLRGKFIDFVTWQYQSNYTKGHLVECRNLLGDQKLMSETNVKVGKIEL